MKRGNDLNFRNNNNLETLTHVKRHYNWRVVVKQIVHSTVYD